MITLTRTRFPEEIQENPQLIKLGEAKHSYNIAVNTCEHTSQKSNHTQTYSITKQDINLVLRCIKLDFCMDQKNQTESGFALFVSEKYFRKIKGFYPRDLP